MSTITLPGIDDLARLVQSLVGRNVSVVATDTTPTPTARHLVTYVDDADVPRCHVAGDPAFAAYAAAAMAMIPAGRAEEAANGAHDEDLEEIYFEVMNVLSRLVNDDNSVHVRLVPGSRTDPDSVTLASPTSFAVDITGYGKGTLTFWPA